MCKNKDQHNLIQMASSAAVMALPFPWGRSGTFLFLMKKHFQPPLSDHIRHIPSSLLHNYFTSFCPRVRSSLLICFCLTGFFNCIFWLPWWYYSLARDCVAGLLYIPRAFLMFIFLSSSSDSDLYLLQPPPLGCIQHGSHRCRRAMPGLFSRPDN